MKTPLYLTKGRHFHANRYKYDVSNISAEIDLGTLNLEGGIYFIRSTTPTGTSVQKLVYTN